MRRTTARGPRAAPHIYGRTERFKATLDRQINGGEDLLGELEGGRKRASADAAKLGGRYSDEAARLLADYHLWQWSDRVSRWRGNVTTTANRQLADQVDDVLPHLTRPWPQPAVGHKGEGLIPAVEKWLHSTLEELRELRAALGVRRNVPVTSVGRFDEIRASGLIDAGVIDGWTKDSANLRTPKQIADAIGTAKEIAEAVLRAALDNLGVPWKKTDGLQQLMKSWRVTTQVKSLDAQGARQLDQAQAALGNLLAFLAEWRNAYGRGHGRSRYPAGLRPHHARLAVDVADTMARFVVLTMDDLARLPPRDRLSVPNARQRT